MCFSVCLSAKWAIAPNATLQICTSFFISSDRNSLCHGALFQATFSDLNICASIYWFWAFMSTVLEFFSLQLSSVLPNYYIKFNQRGWTMLFFLQHRVWISLLDAYTYRSGGTWTFFPSNYQNSLYTNISTWEEAKSEQNLHNNLPLQTSLLTPAEKFGINLCSPLWRRIPIQLFFLLGSEEGEDKQKLRPKTENIASHLFSKSNTTIDFQMR